MAESPGDDPSRADLKLIEQALRAHWPLSPATQRRLLRNIAALVLKKGAKDRTRIAALRVVLQAQRNQLDQARIDLANAEFEARGKPRQEFNLSQLVAEAEALAAEHTPAERPGEDQG